MLPKIEKYYELNASLAKWSTARRPTWLSESMAGSFQADWMRQGRDSTKHAPATILVGTPIERSA